MPSGADWKSSKTHRALPSFQRASTLVCSGTTLPAWSRRTKTALVWLRMAAVEAWVNFMPAIQIIIAA